MGFPSPGSIDKYTLNDIPPGTINKEFYVVAWCVDKYYSFIEKMIAEIKLKRRQWSVHYSNETSPCSSVCYFKNIFTRDWMRHNLELWLAVQPY